MPKKIAEKPEFCDLSEYEGVVKAPDTLMVMDLLVQFMTVTGNGQTITKRLRRLNLDYSTSH